MPRALDKTSVFALAGIAAFYLATVAVGLGWGLPSDSHDAYLFAGSPWSAEKIIAHQPTQARTDPHTGADVDVDPLDVTQPAAVNADVAAQAAIYRRYRLFTRQPDEMITMMALSGMNPRRGQFDPKLYQYGGLFIYPVGALIKTCGVLGLFPVRGDLGYYLDHPGDFGKFYIVARAYAAAWGIWGLLMMFAIARRLGGRGAGLLAALLFVLLPVVTCLSHEAKPHLPGAVLMLTAIWFAMRALDRQRALDWAGVYICCGAAMGMVLSSLPIMLLIPTVVAIHCRHQASRQRNEGGCEGKRVDYRPVFVRATLGGWLVAGVVYLLTNPYVAINVFTNRAVLASNFGNSLAMYAIDRVCEGAFRALQLTAEGATWPVLLGGLVGLVGMLGMLVGFRALGRRRDTGLGAAMGVGVMLLAVPTFVLLAQFVLIGAGKPDEYGRFGVFLDCVLGLSCAVLMSSLIRRFRAIAVAGSIGVVAWCAWGSAGYLWSFHADAVGQGSRDLAARYLAELAPDEPLAVIAEPAPYACPPLDFARRPVVLYRDPNIETRIASVALWNDAAHNPAHAHVPNTPRILIAALDDPESELRAIRNPSWSHEEIFESRPRFLPRGRISWANKPIVILQRKDP